MYTKYFAQTFINMLTETFLSKLFDYLCLKFTQKIYIQKSI